MGREVRKFDSRGSAVQGHVYLPGMRGCGTMDKPRLTEQIVRKNMAKLQELELVEKGGSARATHYVLNERRETT